MTMPPAGLCPLGIPYNTAAHTAPLPEALLDLLLPIPDSGVLWGLFH